MRATTFSRLMQVFILVILICILLFMAVFYFTLRDVQIENRMNALKAQAYDIAYLAGSVQTGGLSFGFGIPSSSGRELMLQKLRRVYEEYSAYCMVVDRNGEVTAYFLSLLEANEDLRAGFDAGSIFGSLKQVLRGQEIVAQTTGAGGPMFTVAVPWISNNRVLGGVYIQTAVQTVRASYEGLVLRIAVASAAVIALAAVLVFTLTRRITKPLQEMAQSARRLSTGDFDHSVSEVGSREIHELAVAFNSMSGKLSETEHSRREFIANLSHELRSPMTNIHGYVQAIVDGTVSPEQEKHYLGIVLDETKRLTKLVSGLLNLSRMENSDTPLSLTGFDINELIRLVLSAKANQIEQKGIDVRLFFGLESLPVLADRDQIEQVLINLIDNGVRFTPSGGHIELSTRAIDADTAQVIVRDNGMGVLPEDAPHIFERFYTADKARTVGKGTGLGLAICKTILDRHRQTIALLPATEGAAFAFTLQRNKENKGAKA